MSKHLLALALYGVRIGESFTLEFQDCAGAKCFIVLKNRKELMLIEMARPHVPLIRENGAVRSELQQPITQVKNWIASSRTTERLP
jgi:hypothetical protein